MDCRRWYESILLSRKTSKIPVNQGLRFFNGRFLRLNEALIRLNEGVHLAKWTPIRLNALRIKLAQPRIRPNDTLHLAKWGLI